MKIWGLLDSPEKWTWGACARDKAGAGVLPQSQEAACFCLIGAVRKCYGQAGTDEYCQVIDRISSYLGVGRLGPTAWNDAPERTYAEVFNLAKELDV